MRRGRCRSADVRIAIARRAAERLARWPRRRPCIAGSDIHNGSTGRRSMQMAAIAGRPIAAVDDWLAASTGRRATGRPAIPFAAISRAGLRLSCGSTVDPGPLLASEGAERQQALAVLSDAVRSCSPPISRWCSTSTRCRRCRNTACDVIDGPADSTPGVARYIAMSADVAAYAGAARHRPGGVRALQRAGALSLRRERQRGLATDHDGSTVAAVRAVSDRAGDRCHRRLRRQHYRADRHRARASTTPTCSTASTCTSRISFTHQRS